MKRAVLLIGHGSKQPGFQKAMKRVAQKLSATGRYSDVACAYLEVSEPSIERGIEQLVRRGAKRVTIVPYFVLSGRHVEQHIPAIVRQCRKKYASQARIELSRYLGYHDKLVAIVEQRIRETR